jgi:hypothetical protein
MRGFPRRIPGGAGLEGLRPVARHFADVAAPFSEYAPAKLCGLEQIHPLGPIYLAVRAASPPR